jgi:hypothetical protein
MNNSFISPFIKSQFPEFYKDQGPNFIAFVQAYYEWMEQTGKKTQAVGAIRSLLNTMDIDNTASDFINHFINTYLSDIPVSIVSDPKLLVKHILDLYRSKGSQRSYELLFRLVFNEDIQLNIPGNFIFKPSDNIWSVPRYIETTDHPFLSNLIGNKIYNIAGSASAIVENISRRTVKNKIINIVYISSEQGRFKFNDRILCDVVPQITVDNSPTVVGSLTAIALDNGGFGFNIGDTLGINGSGVNGKARVVSITNQNGKVNFNIINGGFGYSTNAVVTVATTVNINIANSTGIFSINDNIIDNVTNANGTVTFANSSFVQIINYSTPSMFVAGDILNNSSATASAKIISVLGGSGAGATFSVGGIINPVVYSFNTDIITPFLNVIIENPANTFNIAITTTANTFTVGNTVTGSANVVYLEGTYNTTNTIVNFESLSNTSLGLTNMFVYKSDGAQVSITATDAILTSANIQVGTILVSNISSSLFVITNFSNKQIITGIANVVTANSTQINVNGSGILNEGYFIASKIITDTQTGHTANIASVIRNTDWLFSYESIRGNLDANISQVLHYITGSYGTISYLSSINPGVGYTTKPYINITQSEIAALQLSDVNLNIIGNDAVINSSVLNANGIVTAVSIIDSGIGYVGGETVNLFTPNTNIIVSGVAIVDADGIGLGGYTNRKSFPSDLMNIQDSNYYQNYSYEIVAKRMLSTYETLVRKLVHPSGMALFGKYRYSDIQISSANSVQFSLLQANNIQPPIPVNFDFTTGNTNISPLITFTRASNATYFNANGLMVSANNNVPRIDYNSGTGLINGLLMEEQRTNILISSTNFSNTSVWQNDAGPTVTYGFPAPDGSNTATLMIPGVVSNLYDLHQFVSTLGNNNYAFSVYIKPQIYPYVHLQIWDWNSGCGIELWALMTGNGTITSINNAGGTASGATGNIQLCANNWYRITLSGKPSTNNLPLVSPVIRVSSADHDNGLAGDGIHGYYLWGAQMEQSTYATSFIYTTTAQVTRAGDIATISGNNFVSIYNYFSGGTLGVETLWNVIPSDTTAHVLARISDGIGSNVLEFYNQTDPYNVISTYTANGVNYNNGGFGSHPISNSINNFVATSWSSLAAFTEANNGLITGPGASYALMTAPNKLCIGGFGGLSQINGYIRKLVYDNYNYSNSALITLTTSY